MNTSSADTAPIVVGIDGSSHSSRAAWWAGNEAAASHRPLVLVHVADDRHPEPAGARRWGHGAGTTLGPSLRDDLLAQEVDRAAAGHPGLDVTTRVVPGDPVGVLLDSARWARMIVVGSHGRGTRHRLLGSVSAQVAQRATCPVAIVRPEPLGGPGHGVAVGIDGTPDSLPVLAAAFRIAAASHLRLTVIHCISRAMRAAHRTVTDPAGPDLGHSEALVTGLIAGLREQYADVHVEIQVRRADPADALRDAGAEMDMLVIGRHDEGRHTSSSTNSLMRHQIRHALTTIVVVPTGVQEAGAEDEPAAGSVGGGVTTEPTKAT